MRGNRDVVLAAVDQDGEVLFTPLGDDSFQARLGNGQAATRQFTPFIVVFDFFLIFLTFYALLVAEKVSRG